MYIGKVVGNVVSTKKTDSLIGNRFLIVDLVKVNQNQLSDIDKQIVAVDTVGAGRGEYVLVSLGSAARQLFTNQNVPVDAAIIGIIDDFIE